MARQVAQGKASQNGGCKSRRTTKRVGKGLRPLVDTARSLSEQGTPPVQNRSDFPSSNPKVRSTNAAGVTCSASEECVVFVAMSFRVEEDPALVDYFEAMRRAAYSTRLPLDIRRIDSVQGDFEISQRILEEIDAAKIVIADFTLSPRNVYFEAGYARGKGKRVIQTARKDTHLEFDTRGWKTIFYKNATELEVALAQALSSAYYDVVSYY